jgi:hypothetical protein
LHVHHLVSVVSSGSESDVDNGSFQSEPFDDDWMLPDRLNDGPFYQNHIIPLIMGAESPPFWKPENLANSETLHGVELKSNFQTGFYVSVPFFNCSTFEIRKRHSLVAHRAWGDSDLLHRAYV